MEMITYYVVRIDNTDPINLRGHYLAGPFPNRTIAVTHGEIIQKTQNIQDWGVSSHTVQLGNEP